MRNIEMYLSALLRNTLLEDLPHQTPILGVTSNFSRKICNHKIRLTNYIKHLFMITALHGAVV